MVDINFVKNSWSEAIKLRHIEFSYCRKKIIENDLYYNRPYGSKKYGERILHVRFLSDQIFRYYSDKNSNSLKYFRQYDMKPKKGGSFFSEYRRSYLRKNKQNINEVTFQSMKNLIKNITNEQTGERMNEK